MIVAISTPLKSTSVQVARGTACTEWLISTLPWAPPLSQPGRDGPKLKQQPSRLAGQEAKRNKRTTPEHRRHVAWLPNIQLANF